MLCCCLLCLSGFSPVVSLAYNTEAIYSVSWSDDSPTPTCYIYNDDIQMGCTSVERDEISNYIYMLNNNACSSMDILEIGDSELYFDLLYLPDIYDYYMVGSLYTEATTASLFSFYPNRVRLISYPCDGASGVNLENLEVYHHDNNGIIGFTFSGKVPLIKDTMISYVYMISNSTKSIAANVKFKLYIIRVEKDNSADLDTILSEKLDNINESINNQGANISTSIENAMNEINNAIEDQFTMEDSEDFGVEDIVNQVNKKAGVLAVGITTLVNFLDLFDASNATSTELTFPGFSIEVQGVKYQVWNNITYDLSELESQFGALLEVVRWGCTMVVYLAVLNYLVHAYEEIFGG